MLHNFKLFFLLFIFFLSSCGGGSGSNDDGSSLNTISGTAAKGIIKNGIVKVYGVTNGTRDLEELASDSTDDKGRYSLDIKDYTGPIFVEVTADSSTKMICDITPNCGETPFGEEINLDSDFIIKAVVGKLEKNKPATANINTITSLVAAKVEAESNIDLTKISNANSQVANLLGMTGNLSEKPMIDITNEVSLRAAEKDERNMAILNSAIASSMENEISISEGLNKLTREFADNNGQFLQNGTDNQISIAKIYDNANDILEMDVFSNVDADDLNQLSNTITVIKVRAESETPGTYTESKPTDIKQVASIESAVEMVEDIREFSLQATYKNSQEASVVEDLDLALELVNSDELEDLNQALDIATIAFEEAYIHSLYEQEFNESNQLFEYKYGDLVIPVDVISTNGELEYSINKEINSIYFDLKVSFSGKSDTKSEYGELCEFDEDFYQENQLYTENSNGFFEIEGLLKSQNLEMKNIKGRVSARYDCSYITSLLNSEELDVWEIYSAGSIDIEVEINQTTSNPLTFKGDYELSTKMSASYKESYSQGDEYKAGNDHDDEHYDDYVDNHDADQNDEHFDDHYNETGHDHYDENGEDHYDEHGEDYYPEYAHSDDHYDEHGEDHYDEHLQAYTASASFLLNGEFEKGGKKIGVTIKASVSESEGELWVNGKDLSNENTHNSNTKPDSKNFDLAELTDFVEFPDVLNFNGLLIDSKISLGISLDFTTTASSDITGITLNTTNSKGDNRKGELSVKLGNKRLSFDYSLALEDYQLTVTNQNGTTLKLSDQCYLEKTGCENIGFILVNNEKMATISYDRSINVAIVTYNNGRSEPLSL